MANDLNRCDFIGRLGQDPETRYQPSGDAVTNIRLAVGWKGKQSEGVEWVPVVFFGRLAEIVGEYLKKGSRIYVSGRFKTRKWTDKQGQDRYSTEIVASEMQMLDGRQPDSQPAPQRQSAPAPSADYDDSIPFMRLPGDAFI